MLYPGQLFPLHATTPAVGVVVLHKADATVPVSGNAGAISVAMPVDGEWS